MDTNTPETGDFWEISDYGCLLRIFEKKVDKLTNRAKRERSLSHMLFLREEIIAWQEMLELLEEKGKEAFVVPTIVQTYAYRNDSESARTAETITRLPRTSQQEMKEVKEMEEKMEKILATKKVLSERLCILLRKMEKKIDQRLEENERTVKREKKEIAKAREKARREAEAELNRAKRNAAY